jgi:hypothetical protein
VNVVTRTKSLPVPRIEGLLSFLQPTEARLVIRKQYPFKLFAKKTLYSNALFTYVYVVGLIVDTLSFE